MRGVFGIVGLLVTLAIVGILVKKQLHTTTSMPVVPTVPAVAGSSAPAVNPNATVQQQSQQIQQQYKQAVEGAIQPAARPDPDASK